MVGLVRIRKKWPSCSTDREKRHEKSNGQSGTYRQSTYCKNNFSLRKLQDRFQGRKDDKDTIITVWDSYIQSKTNEGKAGSARCSKDVRNRFVKDLGTDISFADINRDFILKWVKIMKENELSTTTIAIALRNLKTIINMCIANGLMKGDTKENVQRYRL